ncbi:MAG: GAF domain-containing protein [Anaerolineae bacterium]|nr:GAF domain-containing protein [Anaerolineae bacterium]
MTSPTDPYEILTQRLQELDILFEIGKSVTSLLDLEAILHSVVRAAVTLTRGEESYLILVDEASGHLYLRAETARDLETVKDFWARVTDSISAQVVQTGQPIILSKSEKRLKIKTGLAVYSMVNVPLKVGQTVIGVLGINNRQEKRAFTHHDQELLSALADWAAIAIQNAKLYATTKEHSRDLELINHISRLVSSTLDIEQIPRLLIQRTAEIFEAACGSLALIDKERQAIVFQAAYDNQGTEVKSMKDLLMPFGQGIVGLVARTGKPYLVNDVQDDPAWSPMVDQLTGFQTKKVIAVPLIVEGEVLGVIELLNKDKDDFTNEDVKLLTLVASSTAIAVKNAQQYAALKTANEALKQAQAQRIATERWTVLGQAAGNLAHRINNSTALVPIATQHLQELLQGVEMPAPVRQEVDENLARIRRNTLYTVELAMALLRRFRKIPSEAHDVNRLIQKAVESVDIPNNIRLVCHLDPDLPPVDTSDLLTDAFVELITNAIKTIGAQTGIVRIASFKVGHNVSVQITDSGQGISSENIGRIFDMFYTTNPQGLGFGLWWVKTFLEQQNGQITVESQPNEGSTFTITLPGKSPNA